MDNYWRFKNYLEYVDANQTERVHIEERMSMQIEAEQVSVQASRLKAWTVAPGPAPQRKRNRILSWRQSSLCPIYYNPWHRKVVAISWEGIETFERHAGRDYSEEMGIELLLESYD